MKLLRYRDGNNIKPGILDAEEKIRNVSSLVNDWNNQTINIHNLEKIRELDLSSLPIVNSDVSLAPCVGDVGKFICIGLNYSDHAEETGMEVPKEPIIFMKATSAICGPNDEIIIPKNSSKSDWEVELGIIIGKETKYIDERIFWNGMIKLLDQYKYKEDLLLEMMKIQESNKDMNIIDNRRNEDYRIT